MPVPTFLQSPVTTHLQPKIRFLLYGKGVLYRVYYTVLRSFKWLHNHNIESHSLLREVEAKHGVGMTTAIQQAIWMLSCLFLLMACSFCDAAPGCTNNDLKIVVAGGQSPDGSSLSFLVCAYYLSSLLCLLFHTCNLAWSWVLVFLQPLPPFCCTARRIHWSRKTIARVSNLSK